MPSKRQPPTLIGLTAEEFVEWDHILQMRVSQITPKMWKRFQELQAKIIDALAHAWGEK